MILPEEPSKGEYFTCFLMAFVLMVLVLSCVPDKSSGCPVPLYSVGDTVLVDDTFTGTILDRRVLGCGDIVYDVTLDLEVNGKRAAVADISEERITPYESGD